MAGMTAWFASEERDERPVRRGRRRRPDEPRRHRLRPVAVVVVARRSSPASTRQDAPNDADRDPGRLRVLVAKALILVAVMLPLGVAAPPSPSRLRNRCSTTAATSSPGLSSRLAHRPGGDPGGRRDGPPAHRVRAPRARGGNDPPSLRSDDRDRRRAAVPPVPVPRRPRADRDPHRAAHPLAGMAIQSSTDRMLAPFDGRLGMPIGPWQGSGSHSPGARRARDRAPSARATS